MPHTPDGLRPAGPIPSRAAAERLAGGLRAELDSYRVRLAEDLVDAGLSERDGHHADAIATLEQHLLALEAMRAKVEGVVAGALAEREAEAVIDAVTVDEPAAPGDVPSVFGVVRRGAMTAAAVMLLIVGGLTVLPDGPVDPLLAAVEASEEALAAAQAAVAEGTADAVQLAALSGSLRDAIGELPPDVLEEPEVRAWLRVVIADQRAALLGLRGTLPAVEGLLADLDQLTRDLYLVALPSPEDSWRALSEDEADSDSAPTGHSAQPDSSDEPAPAAQPGPAPSNGDGSDADDPILVPPGDDPSEPADEPEPDPADPLDLPDAGGDLDGGGLEGGDELNGGGVDRGEDFGSDDLGPVPR